MTKVAIFAFREDANCFSHVLINAMDMHARGYEIRLIMEGDAVKLLPGLATEGGPLSGLWQKAKAAGIVSGFCRGCATKMGTVPSAETQGLALLDDLSGHPSIGGFRDQGYEIFVF